FESKLGNPGAAAVYLHYLKPGTGDNRGILIGKMRILEDAHANKLDREGGFRIPDGATAAEVDKLAQRLKPSARSALRASGTYRRAIIDARQQ
ncbi:hypothetical protein KJ713_00505, partial [Patescibacteria group bacterium]|nr:hypothetical protein [Patescibacteria group bacterium]